MTELKVIDVDRMADVRSLSGSYYLKSEADKVIRHSKYKRCKAMAKWCYEKGLYYYGLGENFTDKIELWGKWEYKWLELAERFK